MSDIKVALYTISYAGLMYKGPHVPLKELIPKIKAFGSDGIEICAKRPFAFPPDLDAKARKKMGELAKSEGIEICAIAGYNNFSSPIMEEVENELLMLREQIRLASDLGAPIVRVFGAWKGVTIGPDGMGTYDFSRQTWKYPGVTDIKQWQQVRSCLKEGCKWAEESGVTLALQTHGPVIQTPGYEDTLQMIKEVNSDHLKMSLDPAGWWAKQTPEYVRQAVKDCREYIVHSHFGGNFKETPQGRIVQSAEDIVFSGPGHRRFSEVDYKIFISELKKIGYDGYLSYEVCSPVTVNGAYQGIEEVDRRVRLTIKYMKNVISEA